MTQIKRETNCYVSSNERIRPLRDQLVYRPLDWDASSVLIAIREGNPVRGEVVAIGPGRYQWKYRNIYQYDKDGKRYVAGREATETDVFVPTEVKAGDIIELGGLNIFDGKGYVFQEITYGHERLYICSERDVAMVREA